MARNRVTSWNEEEDEALQSLSADATRLYLRGLRRFMNYNTRITGDRPVGLVSIVGFKEVMEFLPVARSTEASVRVKDITDNYVRARLSELSRAGLIERLPKANKFSPMRFFLPLADSGPLRKKYQQQMSNKEEQQEEQQEEVHLNQEVTDFEQQGQQPPEIPMNNIHQDTGIKIKETSEQSVQKLTACGKPVDNLEPDSDDIRLAGFLFEKIVLVKPDSKKPDMSRWGVLLKRHMLQDKISRKTLASVFLWANSHPWWKTRILGPDSLRKGWGTLVEQKEESKSLASFTKADWLSYAVNLGLSANVGESTNEFIARIKASKATGSDSEH